jgi:hypothetical protein
MMNGRGKSDSAIVAGKPTNKAGQLRNLASPLLMGWPGRAPALQDVRSCGGLREAQGAGPRSHKSALVGSRSGLGLCY